MDGLQQGWLLASPPAQEGGEETRQDLALQTVGAGEGGLVVEVEPGGGLQPLVLSGPEEDGDGPGEEAGGDGAGVSVH